MTTMPHYALLCPDEAGHLISNGAVARELVRRGHQVTVIGRTKSTSIVQRLDLPLHALNTSGIRYPFHPLWWVLFAAAGAASLAVIRDLFRFYAEEYLRLVPQALAELKVDGVLADHTVSAAGTVAERAGVPFVTICSALLWHEEPEIPPPFTAWPYALSRRSQLRNRLGYAGFHWYFRPVFRKINRWRKAWNMPPIRHFDDVYSPLAQISQLCQGFDFPRRKLPDVFHYIGSLASGRTEEADQSFPWEKLDGRPLIFASLGTVPFPANTPVYRTIAQACAGLDAQLVLALGRWNEQQQRLKEQLSQLPGDHLVVDFAPQLALLDRASLLITHGGVNTVLEAACRGVPMVVLPRNGDHFGMAARVQHFGLGRCASFRRTRPDALRRLVQEVLSDPAYRSRARQVGQALLAAGGAGRAAEIAEEALTTRLPVTNRAKT
jgi:zeaxanthin glucosyltransferase